MTTSLVKFDAAKRALMEARSIDELKDVRDKAEALRGYIKQRDESHELQNDVAEIKIRAERRIGELIKEKQASGELAKRGGDRKSNCSDSSLKLADLGISHHQSSDWQAVAEMPDEDFEEHIATTKEIGELTSAAVTKAARQIKAGQPMSVTVFSHESVEYYTPPVYVDAARALMGGIDLDPASCDIAQEWIQATTYYTIEDNGIAQDWLGRVWLNPPYSKSGGKSNQDIWSSHLALEYQSGNVTEAVLLVKSAMGYKWFENLWRDWPVCFVRERLSFVRSDGNDKGQSKLGTSILYFGQNIDGFIAKFGKFGRIILPGDRHGAL